MNPRTLAVLLYAAAWTFPAGAAEKSAPRAGPADAAAPVPAPRYESVFTGYARFREDRLASWRAVNDEVASAGGHAGILGGAHAGHSSAGRPASPAKK